MIRLGSFDRTFIGFVVNSAAEINRTAVADTKSDDATLFVWIDIVSRHRGRIEGEGTHCERKMMRVAS